MHTQRESLWSLLMFGMITALITLALLSTPGPAGAGECASPYPYPYPGCASTIYLPEVTLPE